MHHCAELLCVKLCKGIAVCTPNASCGHGSLPNDLHINSTSPLRTASLTALHLNTQISPLLNSTSVVAASPCISTLLGSRSTLQKTALSSSGLSTILIPPAVSSNFCKAVGKDERKEEW